jgi:hypothetical protein
MAGYKRAVTQVAQAFVGIGVCSMNELADDAGPGFQEREMDKQRDTHHSTPTLL